MGTKKSGKKKGSKKKSSKKNSGKGAAGDDGPANHGGFTPDGEPIKVWCTDVLKAAEDTLENATARAIAPLVRTALGAVLESAVAGGADGLAEDGTRDLPRAAFVRVGECGYNSVGDLKRRVNEVTGWPTAKMALLFAAPPEAGGRPVKELLGWAPQWPWPPDTTVVHLDDDALALSTYGVLRRSQRRIDAEKAKLEAHMKRMEEDPQYRREVESKKLMAEAAKAAGGGKKKKSGKKKSGKGKKASGKGGKTGPDGKKMSEKELAAFEAKEKAKADRQKAELTAEQDRQREWPENQVYLVLKAHGVPERAKTSMFHPRPAQKQLPRRSSSFSPPVSPPPPFHNSVAASPPQPDEGAPPPAALLRDHIDDLAEKFAELPKPSEWPNPPPPPDPNAPKPEKPAKKKKGSGKKKSAGKKKGSGKKKKK